MIKKLQLLIGVRKLIALSMTLAFIILALTNKIQADDFINIFLIVISFYFGQSIKVKEEQ